ncbi:MAG: hypothetical protein KF886_26315 [Candidatus Hydrogenedentes bacterium]|nr:hypothetical protein [Candidatus Hydrogenedentota bacterium]
MNDRIQEIIALHFDPVWGSPYWLETGPHLPFEPTTDIRTRADLLRFPAFDLKELADRPVEHFIPRVFHDDLSRFVTAETGGATGVPKRTAYAFEDFQSAFVGPFVAAAGLMDFPRNRHWLFIGPSGPHIIGKAARECARALGSSDPFSVDFDPRWYRKLAPGSMGRARYLEHVLEQAERVLNTQDIGVLFSTPPVLEALGKRLPRELRERIAGIHLGGMAAPPEFWDRLTSYWFPHAVALSGYGNTLAGLCPQVAPCENGEPVYVPFGDRLIYELIAENGSTPGTVCFHRLDRSCFLPHVLEGDCAIRHDAIPAAAVALGFQPAGLRDPRPKVHQLEARAVGLY